MSEVTRILEELKGGDRLATDRLLSAVYDELRRLAARKLSRERPGQTLQATELVHEAYLRLLGGEAAHWDNSAHFFAASAEAMRRILVEAARRKARLKHGGGRQRREIDEADAIASGCSADSWRRWADYPRSSVGGSRHGVRRPVEHERISQAVVPFWHVACTVSSVGSAQELV